MSLLHFLYISESFAYCPQKCFAGHSERDKDSALVGENEQGQSTEEGLRALMQSQTPWPGLFARKPLSGVAAGGAGDMGWDAASLKTPYVMCPQ